jgi:hypothetical protein
MPTDRSRVGAPPRTETRVPAPAATAQQAFLPVFAVGNEGPGTSRSPGNNPQAFSVGAMDRSVRWPRSRPANALRDPMIPSCRTCSPLVPATSRQGPAAGSRRWMARPTAAMTCEAISLRRYCPDQVLGVAVRSRDLPASQPFGSLARLAGLSQLWRAVANVTRGRAHPIRSNPHRHGRIWRMSRINAHARMGGDCPPGRRCAHSNTGITLLAQPSPRVVAVRPVVTHLRSAAAGRPEGVWRHPSGEATSRGPR